MILAGDIGGTNTRLALFEKGKIIGEEKRFSSGKYKNLEEITREFLQNRQVDKACFGVAGPVRNGICKATNLPWIIDASHMSKTLNIRTVHLLNDLEANAYGIRELKNDEFFLLNEGIIQQGNQALISAGTGLGEAGLYWDGRKHTPFACEGGHTDFGPRDNLEIELLVYLRKRFGHVSYERVVSGPGLQNLFLFLTDTGKEIFHPEVKEEMKISDPAKVISEWGSKNKDRACTRALHWFISLYGAEAGNVALKFLSFGGLYIGGGIAPFLAEQMRNGLFISSFADKGRFKDLLESIPVKIVLNDHTALLGAASYGEKG